jgi:outer membrane protein, multidrug efflux system
MSTERRRNADDFSAAAPYADNTSNSDMTCAMLPHPASTSLSRRGITPRFGRADRLTSLVVAAAVAASIALVLSGCSTQALHPEVPVPASFTAGASADMETQAAWWESFNDPVLAGLVRRAAIENRDVKIAAERLHAARAGITVSRSFLMPSVSAVGAASDRSSGYGSAVKQALP